MNMPHKNYKPTEEHRKKLSEARKGRIPWNKGKTQYLQCLVCKKNIRSWCKYCSKKCEILNRPKAKLLNKICLVCDSKFQVNLTCREKQHCSQKCFRQSLSERISPMKGKKHTEEARQKMSLARVGLYTKEKSWNWKGGVSTENQLERVRFRRYIQKQVLKRDNYTCQFCGTRGGILHVDHIQSWADYVKLRFNMENCRTLCQWCHFKITYNKPFSEKSRNWGINNYSFKEV